MKKLLIAAAVASLVGTANAQSAFDGVNVQLGVGMGSMSNQIDYSGSIKSATTGESYGNESGSTSLSGKANVFGNISLGYSQGFSNNFNLAANIFYMMGSSDAGKSSSNGTGTDDSGLPTTSSSSTSTTLKNVYGIVVEPGYYFGKESLGFLKLGWAQGKVGASTSDVDTGSANFPSSSVSASANTSGFLYGLGFKQMIAKNVYLGIEAYQIQFASKSFSSSQTGLDGNTVVSQTTTFKPLVNYAGLTLGYRF